MKKINLRIKYTSKHFTNVSKKILGTIFRIFNKYDNKSYLDAAATPIVTIKEIIDNLINNTYVNVEMQKAWKLRPFCFEAEDLQCYYSLDEVPYLLQNWQNCFGGLNNQLIYNNEELMEKINMVEKKENTNIINIDMNTLLDENKNYAYYTSQLLRMNNRLKDQINLLNQNLIKMQKYDLNVNDKNINDQLSKINDIVLKHVEEYPIQVLQMLTSLLSITSAECNKQFNGSVLSNYSSFLSKLISQQNFIQQKNDQHVIDLDKKDLNNDQLLNNDQSIYFTDNESSTEESFIQNESATITTAAENNKNDNEFTESNESLKNNKNDNEFTENNKSSEDLNVELSTENKNKTKRYYQNMVVNLAKDIKDSLVPIRNKFTQKLQAYAKLYTNEKILQEKLVIKQELEETKNLLVNMRLQIDEGQNELNRCPSNINKKRMQSILKQVKHKFNTVMEQFSIIEQAILSRISELEAKQKLKESNNLNELTTEDLINLKLKKADDKQEQEQQAVNLSSFVMTNAPKSIKSRLTEDGFHFYDGSKSLQEWLTASLTWLKANQYVNFANELEKEVNKLMINRKASKALQMLEAVAKGSTYDDLIKQFNCDRGIVMRYIDSVQNTAPAIYLSFGYGSKASNGRDKRVIINLNSKGIIDIPKGF